MNSQTTTKRIVKATLCYSFYATAVGAAALVIVWEGLHPTSASCFGERSIVEILQVVTLLLSICCAFLAGHQNPDYASLPHFFMGAATIAVIREFDFALDRYVFDGAWQILAFSVLARTLYRAWRHRLFFKEEVGRFVGRASFGVMASGFFTVFIFSRLLGQQILWQAIMGEGYMRVVKRAVEEGTELLGYVLICVGTMEYLRETLKTFRAHERVSHTKTRFTSQVFFEEKWRH